VGVPKNTVSTDRAQFDPPAGKQSFVFTPPAIVITGTHSCTHQSVEEVNNARDRRPAEATGSPVKDASAKAAKTPYSFSNIHEIDVAISAQRIHRWIQSVLEDAGATHQVHISL
jgi:hypothetical protein